VLRILNADPDPGSQTKADPSGTRSEFDNTKRGNFTLNIYVSLLIWVNFLALGSGSNSSSYNTENRNNFLAAIEWVNPASNQKVKKHERQFLGKS
jgi:hypothetical protein